MLQHTHEAAIATLAAGYRIVAGRRQTATQRIDTLADWDASCRRRQTSTAA